MADLPINTLIYGSQVRPAVGPVVQPQYAPVPMPDPRRQAQPIAAPSNAVATATDTGGNGFFDNLTAGFSDPLTLMGMQMIGNGGMSVGAPRPMFQGVPQTLEAAQGMKLREEQAQQKRAEQEAEAERKRLLAETIIPQLPANLQALAQVDPEGALAIYQQMQPKKSDPTSAMQNYEYLISQGVSPEDAMGRAFSGGVTVNTGDQGQQMGTIPAGMAAVPDPSNPSGWRLEAIPGSEPYAEQQAAANRANTTQGMRDTVTDTITSEAEKARSLIGGATTGAGGWLLGNLPFSDAADMYRHVGSLKSIAAAENLQQMRAMSPTGGALGNASDADIKLLQDKAGALDPASPRFPEMLDDYEKTLLRIVHGPEAGDAIFNQSRPNAKADSGSIPRITTQQEYDALPAGSVYIAPDGQQRTKR
jgi:hypothetical protein